MSMSVPSMKKIKEILFDEDAAIAFLLEEAILYPKRRYRACDSAKILRK
jgi:hypothetical protein